jgi:enoyl-CoA hydratase/carnithine racemase
MTRIADYRDAAAKLTGEPSLAMLFHYFSKSRLVTIAQIEGRVRGAGSEFVLACDICALQRESRPFSVSRNRAWVSYPAQAVSNI